MTTHPPPDICERLRARADHPQFGYQPDQLCLDAADEIDRLKAQVSEMEKALTEIAWLRPMGECKNPLVFKIERIALAALQQAQAMPELSISKDNPDGR